MPVLARGRLSTPRNWSPSKICAPRISMRVSSRAILTFRRGIGPPLIDVAFLAISMPRRSREMIAEYACPPEPVSPSHGQAKDEFELNNAVSTREPNLSDRSAGETTFCAFCPLGRAAGRPVVNVRDRDYRCASLGGFGPSLRLVGYLAIGHQHRDDHCHLPDGVRDSEHPNPRYAGDAAETG